MDYDITCKPHILKLLPKNLKYDENTILYTFDLDHTLITTKSGNVHSKDMNDWKWFPNRHPENEEEEYKDMFLLVINLLKQTPNSKLVIFTNQGGIKPFNIGYLKNNSKQRLKAQSHHLETRFKSFLIKINKILQYFYNLLKEERVLVYCSIKTPLPSYKKQEATVSKKSQQQFNKFFKVKNVSPSTDDSNINGKTIKNIHKEYYHDIPEHLLQIDLTSNIKIMFQEFDELDKEKLETNLNCLNYRKPRIGMLQELYKDFNSVITKKSIKFYAGDAAGRPGDYSDSDKVFAEQCKIIFKTPEEIFSEYKLK
ncbi:PNK3P-domain-containing protein [Hanseniaspora valbyensis NRRL Y-1626]|uniref:PNK3P-domain-containing protein n=1 Tax=Hanseniaspora valbyensis NRRL Y-1626 TaxID=766949 RepID=A0A1B7TDN7_9ASCO|nr:PNK3P-domain-containing protein [Hanseniaspora valbyensis NRRL Y-1626]